jgi:hypothetical protein
MERPGVGPFRRLPRLVWFTNLPNGLAIWVPIVTSIVSLVLAIISIVISTQDPEVVLIMPSQVYFGETEIGGNDFYATEVYLQPNFVGTGNNNRIELIKRMTLRVEAPGESPMTLDWTEQGRWDFQEGQSQVMVRTFVYGADASPLLVSPNNAGQPLCLFRVPPDWVLKPDVLYHLTLTADRSVVSRPLVGVVEAKASAQAIDAIKQQTQQTILAVPATVVSGP